MLLNIFITYSFDKMLQVIIKTLNWLVRPKKNWKNLCLRKPFFISWSKKVSLFFKQTWTFDKRAFYFQKIYAIN